MVAKSLKSAETLKKKAIKGRASFCLLRKIPSKEKSRRPDKPFESAFNQYKVRNHPWKLLRLYKTDNSFSSKSLKNKLVLGNVVHVFENVFDDVCKC